MATSSLDQTIASLSREGEDYVIEAPEEWAQGRTLYGGMTAALSYGTLRRSHGDLGALRSAQFAFIAPSSGLLRFRPTQLRRGRSSAIVGVDCWNEHGPSARSMFAFGTARESRVTHDFTSGLDVLPPEECEPFHKTTKPLRGFLSRFEYRLASGARLFEPEKRPEFAVWARLRDGDGEDPMAALLALGDALPCAAMASFAGPAAVSTMSWSVDFHQPLPDHGGWRLIRSSSEFAAEGYSLQTMQVYNRAGQQLVSARQVVAIFI